MSNYQVPIRDLPEDMRPRERLLLRGEKTLSEAELLAIILGQGSQEMSALQLASFLLNRYRGLRGIRAASIEELIAVAKGIGQAKAVAIKAALELGSRAAQMLGESRIILDAPQKVADMFMEEMRYFDKEHFRVVFLDTKCKMITWEDISIGGLNSAQVHPREVFKNAIKRSAAGIILIHNHPSGDPAPSREDKKVTARLSEAGDLLGIGVYDHVIIGDGKHISFKASGYIK